MDNHGSEQAGEYHLYGEAFLNNPLGHADQPRLADLYTVDPNNSDYGQIRYAPRYGAPV